jgi:hypothetical protein
MAAEKRKRASQHDDADHRYFQTHFGRLVRERGGEWIVLADGNLVGIGKKERVPGLIQKARSKYPYATPFAAPIPTKEDLECVL